MDRNKAVSMLKKELERSFKGFSASDMQIKPILDFIEKDLGMCQRADLDAAEALIDTLYSTLKSLESGVNYYCSPASRETLESGLRAYEEWVKKNG